MTQELIWAGWEYLNKSESHMVESKRHLFRREDLRKWNASSICGVIAARGVDSGVGRDVCKRCESAELRILEILEVISASPARDAAH